MVKLVERNEFRPHMLDVQYRQGTTIMSKLKQIHIKGLRLIKEMTLELKPINVSRGAGHQDSGIDATTMRCPPIGQGE
jgi:hypothetical protein